MVIFATSQEVGKITMLSVIQRTFSEAGHPPRRRSLHGGVGLVERS